MAGRGPAPKDTRSRARDQARRDEQATSLVPDGVRRGPELPELPGDDSWPDQTRAWWDTWRTCAQAATFTATDWSFLLDTAVLHMRFWDGDYGVAGELRLRAAKFGATPEDRARLKIQVGAPKPDGEGKPAQPRRAPATRARRARVLKAVGDD